MQYQTINIDKEKKFIPYDDSYKTDKYVFLHKFDISKYDQLTLMTLTVFPHLYLSIFGLLIKLFFFTFLVAFLSFVHTIICKI